MSEMMKQNFSRLAVTLLASALAGVMTGGFSSYVATMISLEKLESRVTRVERSVVDEKLAERTLTLETAILRHEQALERDFSRHEQMVYELAHKTDDQEKRLTRLETLVSETQRLLAEISADVKSLLRGRK